MRASPNLPDCSPKSNESSYLLDAVLEIGDRRRRVLVKMKEAVQKSDRDAVLHCAKELLEISETGTVGSL